VSSVAEKPAWAANSRPCLRAVTTSASVRMGIRSSPATAAVLLDDPDRVDVETGGSIDFHGEY
jgi:hypothetical protein